MAHHKKHCILEETDGLSHDALACRLGEEFFNQNARYVAQWNKWVFWNGTRWEIDERLSHMTRVREFLRSAANDLIKQAEETVYAQHEQSAARKLKETREQARLLRNKSTVASVEILARSNPASVISSDAFDADLLLLGTPGGAVDLRTGSRRPSQRSDMITKVTACTPAAPGSKPRKWLKFLDEIFDGDEEMVKFMQILAGYALTGCTNEHKLFFLHGKGRNGKSTYLNTLLGIFGDYSRKAAAETFLNTMGNKHSTGLAGLQGARLVVGSELPAGKEWDDSVIKDLTGGDRMTARFMRGDYFEFDPQLTLFIAGNNQPSLRKVDEAFRARMVMVPFKVTIPAHLQNKNLEHELKEEWPEILRWAIDGAVAWQEKGLCVPVSVQNASNEYMDEEDDIGRFLADETKEDRKGFVSTSDLQTRFDQWSQKNGAQSISGRALHQELKSRGFAPYRSPQVRGFRGLSLL